MPFDYKQDYYHYKNYYIQAQQLYHQKPVLRASFSFILTLLALSFFGLFAIKPTLETIAKLQKELETQKKVEAQLEQKITDLQKAQVSYTSIEKDLIYLDYALPKEPDFIRLVWEINYLAYTTNVHLVDGSFSGFPFVQEKTKEDLNTQDIKITLTGQYENIVNFLSGLEKMDRITSVSSLTFDSKAKVVREGIAAFINASTYWQPKSQ